jgi:hypothetical protein
VESLDRGASDDDVGDNAEVGSMENEAPHETLLSGPASGPRSFLYLCAHWCLLGPPDRRSRRISTALGQSMPRILPD